MDKAKQTFTKIFEKDPLADLIFTRKWNKWLGSDTIATSVWIVDSGITKVSDSKDSTSTTIRLSGGTAGNNYTVTNKITTTTSTEIDARSWQIRVIPR